MGASKAGFSAVWSCSTLCVLSVRGARTSCLLEDLDVGTGFRAGIFTLTGVVASVMACVGVVSETAVEDAASSRANSCPCCTLASCAFLCFSNSCRIQSAFTVSTFGALPLSDPDVIACEEVRFELRAGVSAAEVIAVDAFSDHG